jgi:hypothetical protein
MKLVPLLFGVSLVANASLLLLLNRPAASTHTQPSSPTQVERSSASAERSATVAEAKSPDPSSTATAVSWPELSAASLPDLIARLRAAGFPRSVLRAVASARASEQMAAKRKAILSASEDIPYWKVKRPMFDAKLMMAQRELYQEQSKLVKEALGADALDDDEMAAFFRKRLYGDISADKEQKLQRVTGDYGDLRNSIYAETNGMLMPEDQEKLAYLEKEMRQDLTEILTPQELENYEFRMSATANELRSQLTTFQPTEAEFRALFQASRAVEEKYGSSQVSMTSDKRQQRTAALNEQAKAILSPERYAAFEQATNPTNSMLNRIVGRYNLPETVVPQVNAVQKDIL